jgi:hypothetical protein
VTQEHLPGPQNGRFAVGRSQSSRSGLERPSEGGAGWRMRLQAWDLRPVSP